MDPNKKNCPFCNCKPEECVAGNEKNTDTPSLETKPLHRNDILKAFEDEGACDDEIED